MSVGKIGFFGEAFLGPTLLSSEVAKVMCKFDADISSHRSIVGLIFCLEHDLQGVLSQALRDLNKRGDERWNRRKENVDIRKL